MKSIVDMFTEALIRRHERKYENFYVAVDLHGTIFKPSKITNIEYDEKENTFAERVLDVGSGMPIAYPFAINTLRLLSSYHMCRLILWTSSIPDEAEMARSVLEDSGVRIFYINENPECNGNGYADFRVKFCFDILLDDKAGFDPEHDWKALWDFIRTTDWEGFYENADKKITEMPDIFG